jgi:hypothetical protein
MPLPQLVGGLAAAGILAAPTFGGRSRFVPIEDGADDQMPPTVSPSRTGRPHSRRSASRSTGPSHDTSLSEVSANP